MRKKSIFIPRILNNDQHVTASFRCLEIVQTFSNVIQQLIDRCSWS